MRHLLLVALLGACGSDDTEATSVCDEETRATPLAAGDSFSTDGLTVTVSALSPEPPEVGANDWTLAVSDSEGCTVTVSPTMPDHGHGADVGSVSEQDGAWLVDDLEFTMGGYWRVDVEVDCDGAVTTVPVELCVDA